MFDGIGPRLEEGGTYNLDCREVETLDVCVEKSITYKERYSITFLYHICILLHFESNDHLHFPLYLCQILSRMEKHIQSNSRNANRSMYHHCLIKNYSKRVTHER
jgi:hypothetical protein